MHPDNVDDADDGWTRVGPTSGAGEDPAGQVGRIPLPGGGVILHDDDRAGAWLQSDVAVDLARVA